MNDKTLKVYTQNKSIMLPKLREIQSLQMGSSLLYLDNLDSNTHLAVSKESVSVLRSEDEVEIMDTNDLDGLITHHLTKSQVNKVKPDLVASIADSILIHNISNSSLRTFKSCTDEVNPHAGAIINDLDWNPKVSNVIATGDNRGLLSIFDLKVKKPTLVLNQSSKSFLNINSIHHVKFDSQNALNVLVNCTEGNHQVVKLFDLRKTDNVLHEQKSKRHYLDIHSFSAGVFEYVDEDGGFGYQRVQANDGNRVDLKVRGKLAHAKTQTYSDELFKYKHVSFDQWSKLYRGLDEEKLGQNLDEYTVTSAIQKGIDYQGFSSKKYNIRENGDMSVEKKPSSQNIDQTSMRLSDFLQKNDPLEFENQIVNLNSVQENEIYHLITTFTVDKLSLKDYIFKKYAKQLEEIDNLLNNDKKKPDQEQEEDENADNFFASLQNQSNQKEEEETIPNTKLELDYNLLRSMLLNLIFSDNLEKAMNLSARTHNYMTAVLFNAIMDKNHKMASIFSSYYDSGISKLFNEIYDFLMNRVVNYKFIFAGNYESVDFLCYYLLKKNMTTELELLSKYLWSNNFYHEYYTVNILSNDYKSYFEHYKSSLNFDSNDNLIKSTCKLIQLVQNTPKLNIECIKEQINKLVNLYFSLNMNSCSIELYKLLGIDMSTDSQMIKMQLHANDFIQEKISEKKSTKSLKHGSGENAHIHKIESQTLKPTEHNNSNRNTATNNNFVGNKGFNPSANQLSKKNSLVDQNPRPVNTQPMSSNNANTAFNPSFNEPEPTNPGKNMDSSYFGRPDFTSKIPPKIDKINPRLKRTQDAKPEEPKEVQNDPFNDLNNNSQQNEEEPQVSKPRHPNSVQKAVNSFGSAFGPDSKKQDYSEIRGELHEVTGSVAVACNFFIQKLQANTKMKDKMKQENIEKLSNLFGLLRDGLVEKDLCNTLENLYTFKDNDQELKNANKVLMKYNNDKHRNWMGALRKILF